MYNNKRVSSLKNWLDILKEGGGEEKEGQGRERDWRWNTPLSYLLLLCASNIYCRIRRNNILVYTLVRVLGLVGGQRLHVPNHIFDTCLEETADKLLK